MRIWREIVACSFVRGVNDSILVIQNFGVQLETFAITSSCI